MKNKIIQIEKGDIVSIFVYGYDRIYLATQIVKGLNSNRVLLFNSGSNSRLYFPCKRVEMSYGWDLKEMVKEYKNDFSIAIVNCLTTDFNTKETNEFIKFLKEDKEMKTKSFVLVFKASFGSFEKGNRLDYKYFNIYKKSIINNCNKQYSFYRTTKDILKKEWFLENLLTKEKICYKNVHSDNYDLKIIDKNK